MRRDSLVYITKHWKKKENKGREIFSYVHISVSTGSDFLRPLYSEYPLWDSNIVNRFISFFFSTRTSYSRSCLKSRPWKWFTWFSQTLQGTSLVFPLLGHHSYLDPTFSCLFANYLVFRRYLFHFLNNKQRRRKHLFNIPLPFCLTS